MGAEAAKGAPPKDVEVDVEDGDDLPPVKNRNPALHREWRGLLISRTGYSRPRGP